MSETPAIEPIWAQFLTERDKAVFAAAGYGARGGFGKRPALLVIDVNYAFCGDKLEPIVESIKKWRTSCGEDAWVALPFLKHLHHRRTSRGWLGRWLLALEKQARRRAAKGRENQS